MVDRRVYVFSGLVLLLGLVFGFLMYKQPAFLSLFLFSPLIAAFIAILLLKDWKFLERLQLGFSKKAALSSIVGIFLIIGAGILFGLLVEALGWGELKPRSDGLTILPLLLGVVFPGVAIGLGEELGWRGYLLNALPKHWGLGVSSLLIGGVWALWHLPVVLATTGITGLGMKFGFTYVLSILFGIFYLKSGSVYVPALMHATYNIVNRRSSEIIIPYVSITTLNIVSIVLLGVIALVVVKVFQSQRITKVLA